MPVKWEQKRCAITLARLTEKWASLLHPPFSIYQVDAEDSEPLPDRLVSRWNKCRSLDLVEAHLPTEILAYYYIIRKWTFIMFVLCY